MGLAKCCKAFLAVLLIALNSLGLVVALSLLGISVWQWLEYVDDPSAYEQVFGTESREVLIFFISGCVALVFLTILGILAGVFSLCSKLRYIAGIMLFLYMLALLAVYTLEIISITLNYASFYLALTTLPQLLSGAVTSFPYNDTSKPETRLIIYIQTLGQCCGWDNHTSYAWSPAAIWFNDTNWRPTSCCGNKTWTPCIYSASRPDFYDDPCEPIYRSIVQNVGYSVFGLGVVIAVVELLVLIIPLFLLVLVCRPKGVKSEKM